MDTGARSSALHAFDLEIFERDGRDWVRFDVQPMQRDRTKISGLEVPVLEFRSVRSSSGKATRRPVIVTPLTLLGTTWEVELTLARRDQMGFRMLLGRQAFRRRFLVDAGGSYYGGRPASVRRKKKKKAKKKRIVKKHLAKKSVAKESAVKESTAKKKPAKKKVAKKRAAKKAAVGTGSKTQSNQKTRSTQKTSSTEAQITHKTRSTKKRRSSSSGKSSVRKTNTKKGSV